MLKHLPLLCLVLLLLLSLIMSGCGGISNPAADPAQAALGAFKVAILLPGPIDDNGWSQSGYEGLKLIEKDLGAQVAYTAGTPEDDAEKEKITRQYAEDGFNFIIGHGGEYIAAFEKVAKEFPQTRFVVVSGYAGNNTNLGAVTVHADEAGYLAGVVAALKTKTNKVAYLGGEVYPTTQEEADGFEKGAKATNPTIEVTITWVESWSDKEKAKEIALAQIAAGVDVLAVDADLAAFGALEVAESKGVKAIGWVQDQHEVAPQAIITSMIQKVPVMLLKCATLVRQGRWEGKQYKFGLREGVNEVAPSYGALTSDEETQLKQVQEDLISGKINILP